MSEALRLHGFSSKNIYPIFDQRIGAESWSFVSIHRGPHPRKLERNTDSLKRFSEGVWDVLRDMTKDTPLASVYSQDFPARILSAWLPSLDHVPRYRVIKRRRNLKLAENREAYGLEYNIDGIAHYSESAIDLNTGTDGRISPFTVGHELSHLAFDKAGLNPKSSFAKQGLAVMAETYLITALTGRQGPTDNESLLLLLGSKGKGFMNDDFFLCQLANGWFHRALVEMNDSLDWLNKLTSLSKAAPPKNFKELSELYRRCLGYDIDDLIVKTDQHFKDKQAQLETISA